MKKLNYFKKLYLIILFVLSFCTNIISQDQLFRSNENNFRIKFPIGWQIKDGDGPNVVKKAVKDGSSIIIIVKYLITAEIISAAQNESPNLKNMSTKEITEALKEELDFKNYTDKEIREISGAQLFELIQKFNDIKVIDEKVTYLDNEKFAYTKFTCSYSAHNVKVFATNIFFTTIHKGKLYQINGTSETGTFDNLESTFINSINTFVFEDYE